VAHRETERPCLRPRAADEADTLDRRSLPGGPGAELLQEGEKIGHAPMLSDLAVAHAHDVDCLELNFAACRWNAQLFSPMRPVIGLVRRHVVAIGDLPMDVGVKVGKGSA
jgi:hypothetical protein